MLTKCFPVVEFKPKTWEIDEFDCACAFLLEGTEKAMLIDCGVGIGDLKGAVEQLTDKPLIVVLTHSHLDHTGNVRQFKEVYVHPADRDVEMPAPLEARRGFAAGVKRRQKDCFGPPYTLFNYYPYDPMTDIRETEEPMPTLLDLYEGQQFDLGGGRIVTVYECPGHTPGEVVLLDEQTRTLFAGDALNYNFLMMGGFPVETVLKYLKRLQSLGDKYDGIFNGHHDFRPMGAPLDDDCLPNLIALCEKILKDGKVEVCTDEKIIDVLTPKGGTGFFAEAVYTRYERNFACLKPEAIYEK